MKTNEATVKASKIFAFTAKYHASIFSSTLAELRTHTLSHSLSLDQAHLLMSDRNTTRTEKTNTHKYQILYST